MLIADIHNIIMCGRELFQILEKLLYFPEYLRGGKSNLWQDFRGSKVQKNGKEMRRKKVLDQMLGAKN